MNENIKTIKLITLNLLTNFIFSLILKIIDVASLKLSLDFFNLRYLRRYFSMSIYLPMPSPQIFFDEHTSTLVGQCAWTVQKVPQPAPLARQVEPSH